MNLILHFKIIFQIHTFGRLIRRASGWTYRSCALNIFKLNWKCFRSVHISALWGGKFLSFKLCEYRKWFRFLLTQVSRNYSLLHFNILPQCMYILHFAFIGFQQCVREREKKVGREIEVEMYLLLISYCSHTADVLQ